MYDFDRAALVRNLSGVGLLALVLALGCSGSDPDTEYYPPRDPDYGYEGGHGGGHYDPRPPADDDRPYDGIPWRARLTARGTDRVDWRATDDGTIFVTDDTDRTLLLTWRVRRDQVVQIVPKDDEIKVEYDDKYTRDLKRDHRHAIFFIRERDNDAGGWQGGNNGGGWDRPDRPGPDRPGDGRPDRPGPAFELPREMRGASRVANGRGDLSFNTRARGQVWVVDRTDAKVIYRSDLGRGDRLLVLPSQNTIRLQADDARSGRGRVTMDPRHDYEIYFRSNDNGR